MRWCEDEASKSANIPPATLRALIAAQSEVTAYRVLLGDLLIQDRDFAGAVEAYAGAMERDPAAFTGWAKLAKAYSALDRPEEALTTCDRADRLRPSTAVALQRANALRKAGQHEVGEQILRAMLSAGDDGAFEVLEALLRILRNDPDTAKLRAACDLAEARLGNSVLVRAHRALAHSRSGEDRAARHMVDFDRHVLRKPIALPPGYPDIATFNAALAAEMLAGSEPGSDLYIKYMPRSERKPARLALLDAIRMAMEQYLDEITVRGLADVLPPPPESAMLFHANTILRNDGVTGPHIHPHGYISAVYHVQVPDSIVTAPDDRGALALGAICNVPPECAPQWSVRTIKPVPGWLTVFPSHMFHDVIPSNDPALRLSVAADLQPRRGFDQRSRGSDQADYHTN